MHRCGNMLLRDGKNLEIAQSAIQLALILVRKPETVPGYKPPRSTTLKRWDTMQREMKLCISNKSVKNAEDKRYHCPVCDKSFARKKNQLKHTLLGTCGLKKYALHCI